MATKSHDCSKRAGHTICPSCGRTAPDWCAEDEPKDLVALTVIETGSDLPESAEEAAEADAVEAKLAADGADAELKVFQGKRGRRAL